MSDLLDSGRPEGWSDEDVQTYATRNERSGVFDAGEQVATTDVPEIPAEHGEA
jgi:hypothetical protein